ncbi:MAG TPA: hypothetical protein P5186_08595 [Candidatus Paceibacterota bacterium]|nr:hypothetical protein [Verrucomicrobiota bacterium]HRY48091.1 hypothetical protein [Candidatus Paceibacterota bacterium]
MAIVINLLAEQQLAEEMRLRDPARRTLIGAGYVVAAVLVGCLFLWLKNWVAAEELMGLEMRWQSLQNDNKQVMDNLKQASQLEQQLAALDGLSTNRFLWAPVLNALQYCLVDGIEVSRIRTKQAFTVVKKTAKSKDTKAPAATSTESIVLTIEARDFGGQGGGKFDQFQKSIATQPFFQPLLDDSGVKLVQLSPPVADQENTNRNHVVFTVESQFKSRTR